MNATCFSALVFGGLFLAWAATFGVRGLLKDFSLPLKQPDGSPDSRIDVEAANPPTASASVAASPSKSAVRPRRRVAPSDPADLSAALFPGWRLR